MLKSNNEVKVVQIPGTCNKWVQIPEKDNTIGGILKAAGVDYAGYEIRLNNDKNVGLTTTVKHNDKVLLLQNVEGN